MYKLWSDKAWEDYIYWQVQDKKLSNESTNYYGILNEILTQESESEPLRGTLSGCWSRRVDDTNRIIYRIDNENLVILQCRGHYDDK